MTFIPSFSLTRLEYEDEKNLNFMKILNYASFMFDSLILR